MHNPRSFAVGLGLGVCLVGVGCGSSDHSRGNSVGSGGGEVGLSAGGGEVSTSEGGGGTVNAGSTGFGGMTTVGGTASNGGVAGTVGAGGTSTLGGRSGSGGVVGVGGIEGKGGSPSGGATSAGGSAGEGVGGTVAPEAGGAGAAAGATGSGGGSAGAGLGGAGVGGDVAVCEPTAEERVQAKVDIEAFLESRSMESPPPVDALAERLTELCFTGSDVEELIRSGPPSYPELPEGAQSPLGVTSLRVIDCYHVNYASTYYLYVPTLYDATQPTPLVVIGHGGNSAMSQQEAESTALRYISAYAELAEGELGAILVAPATTVGWTPMGDTLIEAVISQTIREYRVDPDRIYITGQSMGGALELAFCHEPR